jgi:3-dehydro-L-gulonate 2-dehydrogenase
MVDMSMSMFSYGMLEVNRLAGRELPVDGGFDDEGNPPKSRALSKKPPHFTNGLLERFRSVDCAGYDRHPAFNGSSVAEVTQDNSDEYGVSQIFIAIEVDKLIDGATRDAKLQRIMDFITAERADENTPVRLPGHEFTKLLEENRRNGITVDDSVWAKIQAL